MGLSPIAGLEAVRTPALLLFAEQVDQNIAATLALLGGDADRWRPHLKTAKLGWTMARLAGAGVRQAKCATPLELETACAAGFADVLLSYPLLGPAVGLTREVAAQHPATRVSALVEHEGMVGAWRGSRVSLFIDLNPGMDRTGTTTEPGRVLALARSIAAAGLSFGGLHYYDGHAEGPAVHAGYDRLLALAESLRAAGVRAPELVTAGTPAFPAARS
jgi:D-serine deaminase-like pyridoxal phosphate-dependent protein